MTRMSLLNMTLLICGFELLNGCSPSMNGSLTAASLTVDTIGTSSTNTTVTFNAPAQTAYSSVTVNQGTDFSFENIVQGSTIFGRTGYAVSNLSNLFRNVGTTQISLISETRTYAGSGTTPTLPSSIREVPDVTKDDEAYNTTDHSPCAPSGCSSAEAIRLTTHTGYTNCGTTQSTIDLRIADCETKNGSSATWNGVTNGIRGEATWKLVARDGSRKEVWQDQRTKLIWSSMANGGTGYKWCPAAGNIQNTYVNCTPGGVNQSSPPVSYCAEMSGFNAGFTETPLTGPYAPEKGGLGLGSTPSVRWRLPTLYDFMQAEIDGIRMVMPDAGGIYLGTSYEWAATISSSNRTNAWVFSSDNFKIVTFGATGTYGVRCVGR